MRATEEWQLTDTRMGASVNKGSDNAAIAAGIRYHKRAYKLLGLNHSLHFKDWALYVEPWFKAVKSQKLRSPDAVLRGESVSIVIEVKKNWLDGRDAKLLDEYLPIVKSAFGTKTFPLMIVGNVRGLKHAPLLSFGAVVEASLAWKLGDPTPTLLLP